MDTIEKVKYPCEPATVEELDKMLRLSVRERIQTKLNNFLRRTAPGEIRWERVLHLRITGDALVARSLGITTVGSTQSFYTGADGSWLLIVAKTPSEDHWKRCAGTLESLWISDAKMSKLPRMKNLKRLTSLDLSGCGSLTELSGLGSLKQLGSLNLSGCSSLTSLNLSECQSLTELPGLGSLTRLTRMNLFKCSSLKELPGLGSLIRLTRLNLFRCSSLKELPGLENLSRLTYLCLDYCQSLTELPDELRHLDSLRNLGLEYLKLRTLPDWLPDIAERFSFAFIPWGDGRNKAIVYLDGTTVEDMPDMSIFKQPYEMVVEWFKNRRQGDIRTLNEIKVVFLGDGEAGKSYTIARLMNDGGEPVDYIDQSTPGIFIKRKHYTVDGRKFRVNYWDFGGQEIMHSMHRIFLTERTMYVILLNARDDTQSDRAKYWLHNVKAFAPEAPVLLVLNKIDQNLNASVDEKDLRARYDNLTQVVRLSALKDDQEKFNKEFTAVLLDEIQKTGYLDAQWPTIWTKVKEALENMKEHFIMGVRYRKICRDCQVNDNQKNLLHWFNELGVSFCCDGEDDYTLEDYVILRPDWITNALYILLFNRLEGARNGLIPHKSIYDLLKSACNNPNIRCTMPEASYTANDIGFVLGVMRKFNLSYNDSQNNEFIPMLCQRDSTVDIKKDYQDADTLEFNMEFDYLPNNLLHRLMVERYSELDMENVWRTGARFQLGELGYSAVVVIDSNTLRFFIRHNDPMHRPNTYLTMLKAHVDRIVEKMGLKAPTCQLVYKLDGKREEFDYELLKEMLDAGVNGTYSRIQRKQIPIADILNQSAPDGLVDEKRLLDAIRKSCLNILAEPEYYLKDGETSWGMEDKRNRRIRDDLELLGYDVKDQTQRGLSGTGRSIGDLDLLLCNDRKEPWTIIEALRVSNGAKTEWDKHLDKLVGNYNYFGAPCVYLLTYVDAGAADFQRIWEGYRNHIPKHNLGEFTYCGNSLDEQNDPTGSQYIKTATCRYDHGGKKTTAYHIFVQIPKQNG